MKVVSLDMAALENRSSTPSTVAAVPRASSERYARANLRGFGLVGEGPSIPGVTDCEP